MSFMDEYNALKKKRKKEDESTTVSSSNKGVSEGSFMDEYNSLKAQRKEEEPSGITLPLYTSLGVSKFLNGDNDVAPILSTSEKDEEKERKWFQKGAFEDGYQFGDVTKTILGTTTDVLENVGSGIMGMGEKAVDALAWLAPAANVAQQSQNSLAYNFDIKEYRKQQKESAEFIKKDLYDEEKVAKAIITNPMQSLTGINAEKESVLGEKSDALVQSAGQLAAQYGLQMVGVPWFVTSGVTSFGGEVENALNEGATFEQAGASGAISAGAEILTEKLFGGDLFVKNAGADLATSYLSTAISNKTLRTLAKLGIDAAGEGVEEVASEVIGKLGSSLYKEENLGEILFSEEAMDEYIESFVGGAVLGGGMGAINAVKSGKQGVDFATGLTKNEQAVVDKVYKERVAEAEESGKITQKEKAKIYDAVVSDMEKGYISTDTIEEVLGGETYKTYKDTMDSEDALLQEFNELNKMKQGEMTGEQIDRRAELKQQLQDMNANSQRSQLKTQLGDEVFGLVKGDRLAESYNERARRGQTFEADLTQYDAKQQQTIQKAVESGILNNTRRTHEFVDMVAKISADKGVLFDFTNNEKLKDSGFAVDGKAVNGYVTKDGITVNIDSNKSMNAIVGHEITHVLEGTELYSALQQTLFDYAKSKGDFQGRYDSLSKLYKSVEGADVDAELTADLVGDYLFTDQDFISRLSTENRNVFQKIYDEIKYLCKVVTAGSKEARELEKVKRAFEKAYRSEGKTEGTKYSIKGENANLSAEDKTNLQTAKKMKESGKSNEEIYNETGWYTQSDGKWRTEILDEIMIPENFSRTGLQSVKDADAEKHLAEAEKRLKEGSISKETYERLVEFEEESRNMDYDSGRLTMFLDAPELYEAYPQLKNVRLFFKKLSGMQGYTDTGKNMIVLDPDGLHDVGQTVREGLAHEIQHIIQGVEGFARGSNPRDAGSYEAYRNAGGEIEARDVESRLRMSQEERRNNMPVQFSLSDSDGKQLTKEQQEYFKDSKARDENGNLVKVYHSSPTAGFTVFDGSEGHGNYKYGEYGDGITFFTDNKAMADSYSPSNEKVDTVKLNNVSEAQEWLGKVGADYLEIRENNGNYELFDTDEEETVREYDSAEELLRDLKRSVQEEYGDIYAGGQYEGYVNIKNPLVVDAEGRPWDRISEEFSQEVYDKFQSLTDEEKATLHDLAGWEDASLFVSEIRSAKNKSGGDDYTKNLASAFNKLQDDGYVNLFNLFDIASDNFTDEAIRESATKTLSTNDYVERALQDGSYDGVIIKNVIDYGGHAHATLSSPPGNDYIVFNSNQFKAADNAKPTDDGDIRYSLSEDSEGRQLSAEQSEFFKDSKILDANGSLKVMHHGSPENFTVFDKKKAKASGYYGKGFYFTDSDSHAKQYGNTYDVYLNITNPLQNGTNDITKEQLRAFVEAIADNEDYGIDNYGYGATVDSVTDSVYGKSDFAMLMDINASCVGNMVEAIELFNEVNGTDYNGIVAPTETVAFYPNQIKRVDNKAPTADPDIRFSLSESVEETKDLMALHNLTEQKLLKSLKLGGLPMPSVAIAKAKDGHDEFGEISLVLPKETIDPDSSSRNKLYSGDAWTPTYPKVEYKLNSKELKKISNKINSLVPANVQEFGRLHLDSDNMEDTMNRYNGDMVDAFKDNDALKYAYLMEAGADITLPMKEKNLSYYGHRENGAIIKVAEAITADEINKALNGGSAEIQKLEPAVRKAVAEYVRETYGDDQFILDTFAPEEGLSFSDLDGYLIEARKYHRNGIEQTVDTRPARELIRDMTVQYSYEEWLKDLFSGIVEKEGIRNNKDYFTPSGNRRSFEALHYEHNLENVIKAMREKGEKGIGNGFGGASIFGASTTSFSSIEDMKRSSDRLQRMSYDEYQELRKGFTGRFLDIAIRLPNEKNSFTATDSAAEVLTEAVAKYKTRSGIANYLRKELKGWATYSDQVVDDLIELVNDIRKMPTGYFEAKPQRAVGFDEVAVFVIPYDADVKLKQELLNRGYAIAEYDPKVEGDRTRVLNQFEEYKFSLSNVGDVPKQYGSYNVYGKDIAYTPLNKFKYQEEAAPVQETAPIAENSTVQAKTQLAEENSTEPVSETDLFPDDLAPVQDELERLEAERGLIYSGLETALEAGNANEVGQLAAEYDSLTARIRELEADENQRTDSLTDADMPAEVEAPYYESNPATAENPFENRDWKAVGNPKVKAYMYENPEVRPFFQEEALKLSGEWNDTQRAARWYNDEVYYESGGEQGFGGQKRLTSKSMEWMLDSWGMSYDDIRKGLDAIIEDNGAENIAAAKHIEFMLNDRLLNGYTDFYTGKRVPPNQDYIRMLEEKQVNEYSKEAFDSFVAMGDQYAPVAQDEPIPQKAVTSEAPVKETYEAIRPKREPQPKMVRADSKGKQRKWVGTSTKSKVVNREILPDNLDQSVIHYQPISNKKTLGNANTKLGNMGYESSVLYFNSQFANRKTSLDDIALGERLIQEAMKRGDTKTAGELIQNVAILGTELGQKVQALSIIKKLTPEGQLRMLQKTVERGKTKGDKAYDGVVVTQDMTDKILKTYRPDGTYDQNELNKAVEDVKQQLADQMDVTFMEKVNAWRYLSMLGNPKTHIRNLVSNVAMKGTVGVKNALARTVESVAPIENRTKTWKAASDDVKAFAQKKTVEMQDIISGDSKYSDDASIKDKRAIFQNKILNAVYEFNSDMLGKEDWWFSKGAFTNSLSEFLTANGISTKQDIKKNPKIVEKGINYALEQSQIATFRQYSWLANKINEIERKNAATDIAVGAILPFKKTPINIAKAGLNYSPLGFAKSLTYDISQVKKGNMEASELIDHLAQNVTGSALTLVGYMLAKSGFLNGAGEDDKEGKYDYQLGKQAYSVNIGGATYSLSWLSPVAMPLFVGANAYEQLVEGKEWNGDVVVETLAQTLDPLSEMSFISSLDSVLSSYDSGFQKFAGIAETMAQNYITQFVPTLSSQVATVLDDTKRSTKVGADSDFKFFDETINNLKYKIPFLRETLEPSTDIWGNEVKQTENVLTRAFETFLAPYAKREDIATAADEEIKDLYGQTGDSGVIPSTPYSYFNYDGEKYEMSAEEFTDFKQVYGQTAFDLMEQLFKTDTYKNADSESRAEWVNKVYDYARDEARREYFAKQGMEYTNATEDGVEYYKENPIKGAIENDVTPEEYSFSIDYPEKYEFFKANDITYAEYAAADEDGKRAYTWAFENPGKFTMSKAIADDFLTYYQYKSDCAAFDAKDENGESVSGLKKERVLEYINNLDADYGEKIILFRSMYDSKADCEAYNQDIVDYLNSRDDISYEEMETILKELGFEVDSEGNISW